MRSPILERGYADITNDQVTITIVKIRIYANGETADTQYMGASSYRKWLRYTLKELMTTIASVKLRKEREISRSGSNTIPVEKLVLIRGHVNKWFLTGTYRITNSKFHHNIVKYARLDECLQFLNSTSEFEDMPLLVHIDNKITEMNVDEQSLVIITLTQS